MADELPDDIEQSIPAFKPHADVINAILAALRPLAKIEGQGGVEVTFSDDKIVISLNQNSSGMVPAGYGPEAFTICDSGTPATRNFITDNPD